MKQILGIDIGVSGVKMARVHCTHDSIDGARCWYYPGSLQHATPEVLASFRHFLTENHLAGMQAACSIEDPSLKIRRVELPKMPESDLKEALRWQLRNVVEGPVADYVVRYSHLGNGGETKRCDLVAYAIRRQSVQNYIQLLKRVGLRPVVVEPASVSLLAIFEQIHGSEPGKFYGLVDFGANHTIFAVIGDGKLFYSRTLTGISTEHAAEPSEGNDYQSRILLELQRSIDAFFLMFQTDKIEALFLCGGGACGPELLEFLPKNLGIATHLLDPTEKLQLNTQPAHLYDVALGLALYPL